ncbi:MAG: sigma-70 family RNA polymerase sigma factor [Planctomycetota bacterium]
MTDRQPDVDALFAAFRRGGGAAPLAAVFDATATELLRVACHLLGCVAAAEDAVQETFLAAIEARDRAPVHNVRAWLTGVLHNRVRRQRRDRARQPDRDRLLMVAPDDPEVRVAARELDTAVAAAIDALPEVYRAVLRLHLRSGLSPGDIAVALERPPATVRSQLARGLEQLRERLPGGLSAGVLALAASAGLASRGLAAVRTVVVGHAAAVAAAAAAAGTAATATLIGGVIVSTKKLMLVVAGGLAVMVTAFATGLLDDREPTPQQERGIVGAPATAEQPTEPAQPTGRAAADPVRSAVAAPAATASARTAPARAYGTLLVHVRWHDTGEPAAAVPIKAMSFADANPFLHKREAVTDTAGIARLERVPAGAVNVHGGRGRSPVARVVADAETHVDLTAERFARLRGRVVDADGAPVAGATVIRSDYFNHSSAHAVGVTADDGTFAIDVGDSNYVGARKHGHAPGDYVHLELNAGDVGAVELQLRGAGGGVRGRVCDAAGAPIEGAILELGPDSGRVLGPGTDGLHRVVAPGPVVTTDADGRFTATGLAAGPNPVVARAADHGVFRGSVDVPPGGTAELAIELPAGATVRGRVVDERGHPVAGATVSEGRYGELDSAWVRTDADGRFALDSLSPGSHQLQAAHQEIGTCAASFDLAAGEVREWTAALEAGPTIRGHVVDETGRPLEGITVQVKSHDAMQPLWRTAVTGADGRFALRGLRQEPFALTAMPKGVWTFASTTLDPVLPGGDDVEVVVRREDRPTAFLRGRVTDGDGRPRPQTKVVVWRSNRGMGPGYEFDGATGEFTMGPFPPGAYRVQVSAEDLPAVELDVALPAHATHDLGVVVLLPGGSLQVDFGEHASEELRVAVLRRAGHHVDNVAVAEDGRSGAIAALAAGDYLLQWSTGAWDRRVLQLDPFTIRSEQVTRLQLARRHVERRPLELRPRNGSTVADRWLRVEVRDDSGVLLDQASARIEDGAGRVEIATPPNGGPVAVRVLDSSTPEWREVGGATLSTDAPWVVEID